MSDSTTIHDEIASLRAYLEELQDTGVDVLPLGGKSAVEASLPTIDAENRPTASSSENLDDIRRELGECDRCGLAPTRTHLVFGVGNPRARILFVGEAPGRDEDLKGEPFVGEAGKLLTKIIQAMGFQREEVYICNVLKCRPPDNRNPHPDEIEKCEPFLLRQVQAVKPEAIICLGTFAAHTLLRSKAPISQLRGKFHDYHGIPLMPTFHPAFLLRNPAMKREVWEDVQKVMTLLGISLPAK